MKWISVIALLFIALGMPSITQGKELGIDSGKTTTNSIITATHPKKQISSSIKHQFMITSTNQSPFAQAIPVITYHHLLTQEEKDSSKLFRNNNEVVSVEQFKSEMDYLHENGFETCTLEELDRFLYHKIRLPKKSVVITFDDGYLSNYYYAYPILKKYHFKATLFAVAQFINKKPESFDPKKLNFISWREIPQHADVFEIGSHTYAMHHLDGHGKGFLVVKPRQQVENDLIAARNIFHSRYFAYPYNQYNGTTIQLLKEAGYRLAFTEMSGEVSPSSPKFELDRYAITPAITISKFKKIV